MDGVQLSEGYRATPRRQFTFCKSPEVPGTHLIDLGKMKGWVNFEAMKACEPGAPRLGIHRPNH